MNIELGQFVTTRPTRAESQETVNSSLPWMGREEEEGNDEVLKPNPLLPNHNPDSMSAHGGNYQVDLMEHFDTIFRKKTFNSFKEFDELFTQFKDETGSVFRIKSSCSIAYVNSRRKQHFIPPRFKFVSIKYCCVHFGQPKVSGQGIRTKKRYLPCGCGCVLSLAYNRGALFISQVNMRHNHEVSNRIAPHYAINRRITKQELKQVAHVIDVIPSSRALQYFLKERFHRPVTLQDAKNTRARLKAMQMKQVQKESIQVMPSNKGISQIHSESSSRAILEIKDQKDNEDHRNVDDSHLEGYRLESPNNLQEKECDEVLKNKALSEAVRQFSELMSSCSSSVFWERIGIMNKVIKCWANAENLEVHSSCTSDHYTSNVDIDSNKKKSRFFQDVDLQEKKRITDPNCNITQQDKGDRHLKFLLPVLSDSVQFVSHSVDGSVKLVIPQVESKANKGSAIKRSRGRPRRKESVCATVKINKLHGCTSYQKRSEYLSPVHLMDGNITCGRGSRLYVDNESDSNDFYSGPPFISCMKEPCMDICDQPVSVQIEISDSDVT